MASRRRTRSRGGIGSTLLLVAALAVLAVLGLYAVGRLGLPSLDDGRIPTVAYEAYTAASEASPAVAAGCYVDWTVLAGISQVEARHGQMDADHHLAPNGDVLPEIRGAALDGTQRHGARAGHRRRRVRRGFDVGPGDGSAPVHSHDVGGARPRRQRRRRRGPGQPVRRGAHRRGAPLRARRPATIRTGPRCERRSSATTPQAATRSRSWAGSSATARSRSRRSSSRRRPTIRLRAAPRTR